MSEFPDLETPIPMPHYARMTRRILPEHDREFRKRFKSEAFA